ncbi:hypothetical protein Bbelb_249540 [Branchiostoma belcheri]|nr:hypothetical protein Bbelb_249540 [Branchiostoma belcheri]
MGKYYDDGIHMQFHKHKLLGASCNLLAQPHPTKPDTDQWVAVLGIRLRPVWPWLGSRKGPNTPGVLRGRELMSLICWIQTQQLCNLESIRERRAEERSGDTAFTDGFKPSNDEFLLRNV